MKDIGKKTAENVKLQGGLLCLDFANSVDWDAYGNPSKDEVLGTPDALARWGRRLGVLPAEGDVPSVSAAELDSALELRLVLHRLFGASAQGEEPATADLALLSQTYAAATAAGALERATGACKGPDPLPAPGGGFRLTWPDGDARRVRFSVAADAVALLGDADRLARVRLCPGHDCGWLFFDASGRRRWCSMETCGSRAKMRRLYERQQARRS